LANMENPERIDDLYEMLKRRDFTFLGRLLFLEGPTPAGHSVTHSSMWSVIGLLEDIAESQVRDLIVCVRYLHDRMSTRKYESLNAKLPPGAGKSVHHYENPNVKAAVPATEWLEKEVFTMIPGAFLALNEVVSGEVDVGELIAKRKKIQQDEEDRQW